MVQWFFFQLLNDVFLYNISDCTFWVTDAFTDFINGFLLVVEENNPMEGLLSFGYTMHKMPVMWYSCKRLQDDYTAINSFFVAIQKDITQWGDYAITVFWNTVFNLVDIKFELGELKRAYDDRIWAEIGIQSAKIASDIFIKSPISPSWDYENSDILSEGLGEPRPLVKGIKEEYNDFLKLIGLTQFQVPTEKPGKMQDPRGPSN